MQTQIIFKPSEPTLQFQFNQNQTSLNHIGSTPNLDSQSIAQPLMMNATTKEGAKVSVNNKINIFSKLTIQKKGHAYCKQKLLQVKIKKQFKEYARKTPGIIECIKNISKQIKSSILKQNNTVQKEISSPPKPDNQPFNICQMNTNNGPMTFKMIEDHSVIRQNQLRNLLVPTQGDNDVSSDDEDLRKGMNYLFKQLVYSVGENYQQSKKKKEKRFRAKQSNKQNDCNNLNTQTIVPNQKKQQVKTNNYSHYNENQNMINLLKN